MTLFIRLNQVHQTAADMTCQVVITHDRGGLQLFRDWLATGFVTEQSQGSARSLPGQVVGCLGQVCKALNEARLALSSRIDHRADRGAVLLICMS
jgi:hypothetical protein